MKFLSLLIMVLFSFEATAMTQKERRKLFDDSTEKLKATGIEKGIPKVGQKFPDISINEKKISDRLNDGPVLFIVYRGGWCPYCVKQLVELEKNIEKFKSKNIAIIAVAPETKMEVLKTKEKNKLSFEVISDNDGDILRKLGLLFRVDDAVEAEYRNIGINLSSNQGNDRHELPVPVTYLIDKNLNIHYGFVDVDYTKRPKFDDLIKAVETLK